MGSASLHNIVKNATGQDVYTCRQCSLCDLDPKDDMDVPLATIIQMIMYDDTEVFSTKTIWSDRVLEESKYACQRGLNIQAVLQALRTESQKRGLDLE